MEAIVQVRPLRKATQLSSRNVIIIITIMMFIVLSIVLVNVAFLQNDELPEDDFDDFLAIEGWVASWTVISTTLSFVLNLDLGFLIWVVAAEYLRSHIGEKRFSDSIINSNTLFLITDSIMTAFSTLRPSFVFLSHTFFSPYYGSTPHNYLEK
jgi:hypothetical protein